MAIWNVHLKSLFTVEAETQEEAQAEAENDLENYAGSNDGSELLANADFEVELVVPA